jgi:hypothetical protein
VPAARIVLMRLRDIPGHHRDSDSRGDYDHTLSEHGSFLFRVRTGPCQLTYAAIIGKRKDGHSFSLAEQ